MICLHENYLPRRYPAYADHPTDNPDDHIAAHLDAMQSNYCKAVSEAHQNHVNSEFQKAIIAKCGFLPSVEEMAARGKCFITPEGVYMLAWDHPPLELGEKVDMEYVIAQIEPPL